MLNRRTFLPALAAVLLSACGGHAHHGADHSETTTAGMTVSNAAVMPPLPGRDVALGTFMLTNNSGADDVLLAASAPVSGRVELHNHIKEGDVMKMRRVDSLALAAGESVEFKRGGYHLMMFQSAIGDDVKSVPVTLTFENAGDVTVTAKIAGHDDDYGSHSGH